MKSPTRLTTEEIREIDEAHPGHDPSQSPQKAEITIVLNKGDVEDWVNPEDDQSPDDVERWCDQYADAMAAEFSKAHPNSDVDVTWGDPMSHKISAETPGWSWDAEYDLRQELEQDYEAICGELANMDWLK